MERDLTPDWGIDRQGYDTPERNDGLIRSRLRYGMSILRTRRQCFRR